MRILILLIISFFSLLSLTGVVSAASCSAPPPPFDITKEREAIRSEAISNIDRCLAARQKKQEASIQDFVCPSGNSDSKTDQAYMDSYLSYQLTVAVLFKKIDENAFKFMQSLQCVREKDPLKWDKTLTDRISGNQYQDTQSYEYLYKSYCTDFSKVANLINTPEKKYIETSDTYPQHTCTPLADAKVKALKNLGGFMMSSGIGKSYENDKDTFVDQVKGKYAKLLEKSSRYFRLVNQAVSKIDKYLRETIKK